jgi:enoyl-CoA hydratase/carnithine racemase
MRYKTILVEKKNHIAILTLNRPEKLNAMNLELKNELYHALDELEQDDDVRVVIMTGAGKAFSSGHDMSAPLSELPEFVSLREEEKLLNLDKPVIGARVGGLCYGSFSVLPAVVGRSKANELLFTCDQISAEEAHRIGLVNKVIPHEQLMPAALEMAEKIMKSPPLSIKYTKRALRTALVNHAHRRALEDGWRAIFEAGR